MATASINIGGGEDAFNRYKMPPVVGKVEGKGNGIKTRIDNCFEVARALHRPPGYVCKFFGCELGALTKIDDDTSTYIVNGAFEDRVLAETLKKFIDMFVLCPNCKLPETDIKVKKSGDIVQVCNACGSTSLCDMAHKLCTYIVNNPPDGRKKGKDSSKGSKAERRARKAKAAQEKGKAASSTAETDLDEKARRKAARKAKREADTAPANGTSSNGSLLGGEEIAPKAEEDEDDDVEWSVDMSKEAEEARRREIGSAAAILERTSIVDDQALASKLRAYMDDGKKPGKVVAKSAKLFDGEESAIRGVMLASLLDETPTTAEEAVMERAAPVLAHFGKPMSSDAQTQLCDYFNDVAAKDPESLRMHPFVLKALYDADLLEEDTILKWFHDGNIRDDVRDAVRVIVDWLENASEEDNDEDEDEDED